MENVLEKVKRYASLAFRSQLIMQSTGRTYLRIPIWLLVVMGIESIRFVVVAAVVAVALGMNFSIEKG